MWLWNKNFSQVRRKYYNYCFGAERRLGAFAGTPTSAGFSLTLPRIIKTRAWSPSFVLIVTDFWKSPTDIVVQKLLTYKAEIENLALDDTLDLLEIH